MRSTLTTNILLTLIALLAYNFAFIKGQLNVGTAYGARVACSCHYVGGRDIGDCISLSSIRAAWKWHANTGRLKRSTLKTG